MRLSIANLYCFIELLVKLILSKEDTENMHSDTLLYSKCKYSKTPEHQMVLRKVYSTKIKQLQQINFTW